MTLRSLGILPTREINSLSLIKSLSVGEYCLIHLLSNGDWLTEQISWGPFLCFTLMPKFGKLSYPRILRSWPPVIKNGVSSLIQLFDCVLTMIFPRMLIVSIVKPQYRSLILFSTR